MIVRAFIVPASVLTLGLCSVCAASESGSTSATLEEIVVTIGLSVDARF